MKIFWTLLRRELASFFFTLTGYVLIAAVALLTGLSFVVLMAILGTKPTTMAITEMFYQTYFFWLIVLLVSPVITMRLFALEKATGTFENLMTTRVGDTQVVLAKYAAALAFYMIMWLPLLAGLFILQHFTQQTTGMDAGTLGGMYLGILLTGSLFLSLGCFASSLTRNQMTAAIISFVLGVSLFALGFLAKAVVFGAKWQSQVVSYFDVFAQMHDFSRGVVDTRTVVFYSSATLWFLFLTLRVVESRRWK
jgi:ABC-2 type transport system permease protein